MIETISLNKNKTDFSKVAQILEKSLYPLSNFFSPKEIPDVEKNFLILLFLAWMKRENIAPVSKPRAIVICQNGVTLSSLMYFSIKEMFPEFYFTRFVSMRVFTEISDNEYDVVFSTIHLETRKKLYIVDNIIDLKDKKLLRRKVFEDLYGFSSNENELEIIYKTIDGFLEEEQSEKLKSSISKALQKNRENPNFSQVRNSSLSDLLPIKRINIIDSVKDYVEAIKMVAKPLLEDKLIDQRYVNKILENYDFDCPNIVFGREVAVPHASFEDGSHKLSMSLLKVNKGVLFGPDSSVHIVIMLAPIDTSSHLNALIQIYDLVMEDKDVERIIEAKNKEEIKEIIEKYSSRERRSHYD